MNYFMDKFSKTKEIFHVTYAKIEKNWFKSILIISLINRYQIKAF